MSVKTQPFLAPFKQADEVFPCMPLPGIDACFSSTGTWCYAGILALNKATGVNAVSTALLNFQCKQNVTTKDDSHLFRSGTSNFLALKNMT